MPDSGQFTTVTPGEAAAFLRRGLPLAALLTIIACAGVWFTVGRQPAGYTATASLLSVRQDQKPVVVRSLVAGSLDPVLYRAAVVSGPVLETVRDTWGGSRPLPDRHELLETLRVLSDNQLQSSIVRIEYRADDPLLAADVANAVARELVHWDEERTLRPLADWRAHLQAEIALLEDQLRFLPPTAPDTLALRAEREQRYRDLAEVEAVLPLPQLSILSLAPVPSEPDGRGLLPALAITGVIAVLAGYLTQLFVPRASRSPGRSRVLGAAR